MSSHPLPTFDTRSSADLGPESPENSSTTNGQLGLVIYPLNPLFNPIVISPQRPYSSYDQLGVPLELSPHTHTRSAIRCHLFLDMEPKGDAPVTSMDESKFSTPHTIEGEEF